MLADLNAGFVDFYEPDQSSVESVTAGNGLKNCRNFVNLLKTNDQTLFREIVHSLMIKRLNCSFYDY